MDTQPVVDKITKVGRTWTVHLTVCRRDAVLAHVDVSVRFQAPHWLYRVSASCEGFKWETDWIRLMYLDDAGQRAPEEAIPHAVLLAVYFGSHDFADRDPSNKKKQEPPEPWAYPPSIEFALGFAEATSDWLDWDRDPGRVNYNRKLPPPPGTGRDNWPPISILAEIRDTIVRAVEASLREVV